MILGGKYKGKVVPYQRQTQRQRHPQYEASKTRLALHLLDQSKEWPAFSQTVIKVPFHFTLEVTLPATSAGLFPRNGGDLDNYVKAFLDAAQKTWIIEDDNPAWLRGITAEFQLGDKWIFEWAFLEAKEGIS